MGGRVYFAHEDLMRCRFAVSPLWEAFAAAHTLLEPDRHGLHLPWVRRARLPEGTDLAGFRLLVPRPGYVPDFLTPAPEGPLTSVEGELARVRATPPGQVGAELRQCLLDPRRRLPRDAVDGLLRDPAATRDALADLLEVFWHHLVRPHWSRMRALLDADIAERARRLSEGGLERLMEGLDARLRWDGRALAVHGPSAPEELHLEGRGLVLMPSVFVWPELILISDEPWQPTLVYPARGVGDLWSPPARRPPEALAGALGRTRATLLLALAEPDTTTGLAARLEMSPGSVSGHLTALRAVGLLESWRVGRRVLYARTPLGTALTGRD
ncbi:DUF5937 family protein [Nocardiopsis sp. RSe5-2]|uniref:DUF5937 family protein n=1 Tax=Nocardiopsis endophytica TaxID=3018445 RepID=A0ABT4UA35_9ACTN|nr:DUF5937 family protein [Nocardiopsis endophytica]MDA2813824.1 DUF5937 family protein [Nocardiopsis endophytica]